MGKVKRARQKYHASSSKTKSNTNDTETANPEQDDTDNKTMIFKDNVFGGINIDKTALHQRLPDFDTRSAITSKTLKGLSMKKKDKLKLRREYFMQKINVIEAKKKEDKERRKRKRTAVVGDMSVIEEALPTLDLLLKTSTTKDKIPNVRKKRCVEKSKNRVKSGLKNLQSFKQVLKHPAFKQNAAATIKEHLQNKLKQEEKEDT